jgi:hypothetical protein
MANYGVSDVAAILRAQDWTGWDELLAWLRRQPADAQAGMSQRDKDELLRDMTAASEQGVELVREAGALYRAIRAD